jgi:hypothetical protein
MSNYQAVKIAGVSVHENTFTSGKKVWFVANLIDRSKDLVPFDLPLAAIYAGSEVWESVSSAYGLAKQMRRVLDVETSHPIILDQEGFIMDGWHRVARALIDGKSTIKAVRFTETPPHDYLKPDA